MRTPELQLFRVSRKVLDALSFEEVDATWAAMEELGIAGPPYPDMDVAIPEDAPHRSEIYVRIRGGVLELPTWCVTPQGKRMLLAEMRAKVNGAGFDLSKEMVDEARFARRLYQILLVLLATRNAVKRRTENKLAKLGIGSKRPYRYVTEIGLPRPETLEEEGKGKGTGARRRPHLRRGHVRNQAHGPGREFRRKVWIEPIFVHADEEFVASRTAYNVHLRGG